MSFSFLDNNGNYFPQKKSPKAHELGVSWHFRVLTFGGFFDGVFLASFLLVKFGKMVKKLMKNFANM